MDVEFVSGSSDAGEPSDNPPGARRPRTPRWLPLAAVLIVAAAAVAVTTRRNESDAPRPAPTRADAPVSALDPTLFGVYSTARDSVQAKDVVRPGTGADCRAVAAGTDPRQTIARVTLAALDGFSQIDVARISDQDAGLCSVQLRAGDADGDVLVLRVTAPAAVAVDAYDQSAQDTVQGIPVEYVAYRTSEGWSVVAGVAALVGNAAELPSPGRLRKLAADAALHW